MQGIRSGEGRDEEMYLSGSSPILVVFLKLKRTSNLKYQIIG